MTVTGEHMTGTVAAVVERDNKEWHALLGGERHAVARVLAEREDMSVAATRLSCVTASELTIVDSEKDGWVVFGADDARIATYVTTPRDWDRPVVFAVRGK